MIYDANVNIFLYHVENEVELGVCVSGFEHGWAYSSEVKTKRKEKFLFLSRYQTTGWKALAATKSGFDFMPQRDQTGRFFSINEF